MLAVITFVVNLDATVVVIALPEIGREFGYHTKDLQWVVNAYILALACLLLGVGALADAFGRKRVYLIGLAGFTATSAGCAAAPTVGLLIAARAAQGAFGAALLAVTLALVTELYPDRLARARIIGILTGCATLTFAVGPVLGGFLVTRYGWYTIFVINIPLGLIVTPALGRLLPARPAPGGRVDLPGQLLFTTAATALAFGLIEGNRLGWGSASILTAIAAGTVALGLFVFAERRSRHPMLPFSLVRRRSVAIGCGLNFLGFFAVYPTFLLMTLFLQDIAHLSAAEAGTQFLWLTGPLTVASLIAPLLAARWGTRKVILFGSVLALSGLARLTLVTPDDGDGGLWWALTLIGLGAPMAVVPATVAALRMAPEGLAATTSAIVTTFRQLGAFLGVAVTVLLLTFSGDLMTGMRLMFLLATGAALASAIVALPRGAATSA